MTARIVRRRCGRSGGGGRDPAVRWHRRAADRHRLRDRGLAGHARRHRAPVPVKRRPPDKGIALLLESAAQAPAIGVMGAGRHAARRCVLAGWADPGRPATNRCRAARRPHRWRPHDRAPRRRPPGPARAGRCRRAVADDLRQRVRPGRGSRCRRDPRAARRFDRPHPRRRTGAWRPGVHRRRLQRRAAAGHPRGRDPGATDRGAARGGRPGPGFDAG